MKIRFESDDDLPLGKILNIRVCVCVCVCACVRVCVCVCVFQESDKYYPQVYLKDCFYEYEHENEDDSYVVC